MKLILQLLLIWSLLASRGLASPKRYHPDPNDWLEATITSVEQKSRFLTVDWIPDRRNRVPSVNTLGTDLAHYYFVTPSGKRTPAQFNDLKNGMRIRLKAVFSVTSGASLIYIPKQ